MHRKMTRQKACSQKIESEREIVIERKIAAMKIVMMEEQYEE